MGGRRGASVGDAAVTPRLAAAALALALAAAAAFAQPPGFAPLPDGALSVAETSGVDAELCQDHALDPTFAATQIPPGVRLLSAGELAVRDAALRDALAKRPALAGDAIGSLCFQRVQRFTVDGVLANPEGPTPMAFWWVRVAPTDGGAVDPRMRGSRGFVQLRSWYAREGVDRARILAADPQAEFVDLSVVPIDPQHWSVALAIGDTAIRGDVRGRGERRAIPRSGPAAMTVRSGRPKAAFFTVFVYFGHHERPASASWQAEGGSPLARALGDRERWLGLEPVFQDGWQARSGLYRTEVRTSDQTGAPPAP